MDYTRMAMESNIQMLDMIQEHQMTTMLEESEYIKMCLESGFVVTMEAGNKDGIFARMRDAFRAFIEKIASIFRKKSIDKSKKYKPWLSDSNVRAKIISSVNTIEPINLSPFWKGSPKQDNTALINAINKAYNNAKAKKFDYDFGAEFVKDVDDIKEHAGTLPTHLKNYFKYGEKGLDAVEPVRVTGSELAKLLPDMANYILDYDKNAPAYSDSIQRTLNKAMDKLPKDTPKTVQDSFLYVEGVPVSESSLVSMINYEEVFEAIPAAAKRQLDNELDKESKARQEVQNQQTEQENNLKKAGMSNEKDVNIEKSEEENGNDKEPSADDSLVEYYKDLEYFFKLAYAAYQTSLEDRYVQYVNIFLSVARVLKMSPKFDSKTGEYIKPKLVEDENDVSSEVSVKNQVTQKKGNRPRFLRSKKNKKSK